MGKAKKQKKLKYSRQSGEPAGAGRPPVPINRSIAQGARDNVIAIIGQGRVPARGREIAASAFFLAEHLIQRFEAEHALPRPIVCGEGCGFCCYNQVELTPPEALVLGHYVRENFSPAEKEAVLATTARNLALSAGKSHAALAVRRRELPCPLLRDARCSVYPVRPLVCRAMHALDREHCEAELRTGSLAGSSYYLHRHEIAVSVSAGIREGCRALGLQAETFGLARALQDFFSLNHPMERWLRGEKVFGG